MVVRFFFKYVLFLAELYHFPLSTFFQPFPGTHSQTSYASHSQVLLCVVMHQYINTTHWIYFIVCVYMSSEVTTLYWATILGVHPWKKLILLLLALSNCPCLGKGPHDAFSLLSWCTNCYCLCAGHVFQQFLLDCFTGHFLIFWILQSFCLFFLNIFWFVDAKDMI